MENQNGFPNFVLMPSKNIKPIGIRHYKREWKIFDKRIKELGNRNNFHNYIHNKMESLSKDYKNCPDCILDFLQDKCTERRTHNVPEEIYAVFIEISEKSNVPITTIVDRLIVLPLLIDNIMGATLFPIQ